MPAGLAPRRPPSPRRQPFDAATTPLLGASPGPLDGAAAALGFAPLPDGRGRPLLLVGPPGAGKTLCCAKLATRAVLAGGAPLVVTTDGAKAGGAEQLAAFTRLLGRASPSRRKPPRLARAVGDGGRRGQPELIDSAGCEPFDAG